MKPRDEIEQRLLDDHRYWVEITGKSVGADPKGFQRY